MPYISFNAHTYRHAIDQMIQRGAQSDQQQEEHAIYREQANLLDLQLMCTWDSFCLVLLKGSLFKRGRLMRLCSSNTMLTNFTQLLLL